MEEKFKLLLDKFYKWYQASQFHVGRTDYNNPLSKQFILSSSE